MMKAGDKFAIVCMKCLPKPPYNRILNNGAMTMTTDGDLIFECSACGQMERYVFKKEE